MKPESVPDMDAAPSPCLRRDAENRGGTSSLSTRATLYRFDHRSSMLFHLRLQLSRKRNMHCIYCRAFVKIRDQKKRRCNCVCAGPRAHKWGGGRFARLLDGVSRATACDGYCPAQFGLPITPAPLKHRCQMPKSDWSTMSSPVKSARKQSGSAGVTIGPLKQASRNR